jgi:hypothetical protein
MIGHYEYWKDFYYSCVEWLNYFSTTHDPSPPCYTLGSIEGRSFPMVNPDVKLSWHYANLLPIIRRTTGISIPTTAVFAICTLVYFTGLVVTYKLKPALIPGLLLGIIMYWLFEIISQVPKTTYYFVELFPVALYLSGRLPQKPSSRWLILPAILIINFLDFLPANLALAEYALMIYVAWDLLSALKRHNIKSWPVK